MYDLLKFKGTFLQNVAKLCYKSSTIIIKCKTILNLYNNTDNIVIKMM